MKEIERSRDPFEAVPGERSRDEDEGREEDGREGMKRSVPLYKLFSFADSTDIILMVVGTAGALGAGAIMPIMTVIVGRITDAFGENQDVSNVVREVSKVGKFIQIISTVCAGYTVAFVRGWLLTLAMMAMIPPIVICGALVSKFTAKIASHQHQANMEASLSRLANLNKPEIPILLLGSVVAAFNGLRSPVVALVISTYIGIFYSPPEKLKRDSKICSVAFLAFSVVYLVTSPTGSYLFAVAGAKLIRRIRLMVFHKLVNMEIAWFDEAKNSSGAIGAKLSTDAVMLKSLAGDSLALLVRNIATLIFGLTLAFVASWQLSLIMLALLPLIGLNGWMITKFKKGFIADAKLMHEEAGQVANDAVRNIRTVASFSAEEKVMEMYNKRCEAHMQAPS